MLRRSCTAMASAARVRCYERASYANTNLAEGHSPEHVSSKTSVVDNYDCDKRYIYGDRIDRNELQNTQFLCNNTTHNLTLTMASRALLITGATGKQGGSVVNALLEANSPFEILAVTRNAQSASAQKLLHKSPKIKLITGDFKAIDDIFRQAKAATSSPIWGVFSVQVCIS
jgi:hypothetical protein